MASIQNAEKFVIESSEQEVTLSDKIQIGQHDKFGATAKVDPREIALVRKVDWHIMVRCFHAVFIIYISSIRSSDFDVSRSLPLCIS